MVSEESQLGQAILTKIKQALEVVTIESIPPSNIPFGLTDESINTIAPILTDEIMSLLAEKLKEWGKYVKPGNREQLATLVIHVPIQEHDLIWGGKQ